jgi:hypothetical protein
MQRPFVQCHHESSKECDQIDILALFGRFAFSIVPCGLAELREAIRKQGEQWRKTFEFDELGCRDVRVIYESPDGPHQLPAIQIGILLSEVDGTDGRKTLFVSSVADGYSSMIMSISKTIPGTHLSVNVSRSDVAYPGNGISAVQAGKPIRTVYAMLDGDRWAFFQKGDPLPFEDVDRYRARRRRDRLTPEIISIYLERIGYGSLRREFWIDETAPARVLATGPFRLWRPDQGASA